MSDIASVGRACDSYGDAMPKVRQGEQQPPGLRVLPDAVPDRRVCADRDTADHSRGCVTADVDGDLVQRTGG